MQTKYRVQRILWFLILTGTMTFACAIPALPLQTRATPTPTGQINAIENGTTGPAVDKSNWGVWAGGITSHTSRQYMVNGAVANTCTTDWATDFMFTVDPTGNVDGIGTSSLSTGPDCSPHTVSGNSTGMVISVKGREDQSAFYLNLGIMGVEPMPSVDFGGYSLLISNGACPPVMQSITIPKLGSTSAEAQLDLSGIMTGCAGSKDDLMTNQSQVKLEYRFKCSENPFGSDPNADKICE